MGFSEKLPHNHFKCDNKADNFDVFILPNHNLYVKNYNPGCKKRH